MAEAKTIELANQETNVSLGSPQQVLAFSNQLKKIIVDKQLYTKIRDKNYVNVEGWQIAGMVCGIYPVVNFIEDLSNGDEIKYKATVTLHRMSDDKLMGRGIALCSNKEKTKKTFDEFSIASMAQTRAVGKAYRTVLGYVLKMAGYETTPAEEMTEDKPQPADMSDMYGGKTAQPMREVASVNRDAERI